MKKLLSLLLLVLAINTFAQYAGNPYYFTFEVKNKEDIKRVTTIVSIENVEGNKVWAVLPWKDENKLKQLGYTVTEYSIPSRDAKDYESRMTSSMNEFLEWNKYPTYDLYLQFMEKMANDYPDLCKLVEIGTSEQGRKILALKISNNVNSDEKEPEFFYTSTMHGDETTGFYLLMRYAHYLLSNYNSDATATNLLNNTETWINPNSNPDGTYKGGNNTVFNSWRYNKDGIDLNRNFPDPIKGDHPDGNSNWAKETVVMMNFMKSRNFVLSANFHGGITLVNYPMDGTQTRHPDNDWFKYVSHIYADQAIADSPDNPNYFLSSPTNGTGITNGSDWYDVYGGRQDYVTTFLRGREITIELDNTKTTSESNLKKFWGYNKNALINYHKEVLKGFYGNVVDALTKQPIIAKIEIANSTWNDDQKKWSYTYSENSGFFQRMIIAGTHNIKITAEGYIPKELTVSTTKDQGTNLGTVKLIKIDSEAGIVLSETNGSTTTTELGSSDNIVVCLSKAPSSNVVLTINVSNSAEGKIDKSTLTFTKDNWNIDQTITITGLPDNLIDGDTKYDLTISVDKENSDASYADVQPETISVTNIDSTIELIILTQESDNSTVTSEDGETTDIIKVYLNKKPAGNVTIKITVSDPTEGKTDISEIVFNKNTWDIKTPVTITGISDDEKDGDVEYYITFYIDKSQTDANIYKIDSKTVKVTNRDKIATTINNNDNINITIYPNPTDNNISIISSKESFNFIKIINIKGMIAKSLEFESVNSKTINISELASGLYIIEFGNNQRIFSLRFYKK